MDIITKEFLENIVQQESSEYEIISYTVTPGTNPGDNFASVIYAIELDLKHFKAVEKRHWIIKCYPCHPGRQELGNRSNMFHKELQFYSEWIPELNRLQKQVVGLTDEEMLPLPFAPFVFGECIDFNSEEGQLHKTRVLSPLDNFIILEDLRKTFNFRMTNRRETLDVHHMRLVMRELSKVHAISWAYRNHVEENIPEKFKCFDLKRNYGKVEKEMWGGIAKSSLDQAKELLDGEFGEGNRLSLATVRFKEQVNRIMDYFAGDLQGKDLDGMTRVSPVLQGFRDSKGEERHWEAILHGDCWSNNILFKYIDSKPSELVFLDFQMPSQACIINDLECLFYTSTDAALRKAHLEELLNLYHDSFNMTCKTLKVETLPDFTPEELKFRFHRGKLLGFLFASIAIRIKYKEDEKAQNLEDMDKSHNIENIFQQVTTGKENSLMKERLVEVTQEMYDDGII